MTVPWRCALAVLVITGGLILIALFAGADDWPDLVGFVYGLVAGILGAALGVVWEIRHDDRL